MLKIFPVRETVVIVFLIVLTVFSGALVPELALPGGAKTIGAMAFVLAFFKTRFVLFDFMRLNRAPLAARAFAEAWWIGNSIALIAIYWTSPTL